jgi:hypothetical protein
MRHAYRTSISYEGRHVQTIRFDHRSDRTVADNWSAASRFVDDANTQGGFDTQGVFRGVPLGVVRKFLVDFSISDRHFDLKRGMLLDYLDKAAEKLSLWNVAVVGPVDGHISSRPLGFLGRVRTNRRSRLIGDEDFADIKALMSKRDILVDTDDKRVSAGESWSDLKARRSSVPLLLLYPIEAKSSPARTAASRGGRPTRVALDAVDDLVGIGVVFPGSPDQAGDYYAVELDVPTPEQLDDEGAEEADGE